MELLKSYSYGASYSLQQQDCQEFLSALLDALEFENQRFVKNVFYGKTVTTIKSENEEKKLPEEEFSFLQVALPDQDIIRIDPVLVLQDGTTPIRFSKYFYLFL